MRDGKKKRLAGGKGGHEFWGGKDIERVEDAEEAPSGPLEVPFSRRALLAGAFTIPPAMKKSMEDWGIEMPQALSMVHPRTPYGSPKYDASGYFLTPGWVFDHGDEWISTRQECFHLVGNPNADGTVTVHAGTKIQNFVRGKDTGYTTDKSFRDAAQGGAEVHYWEFNKWMRRRYTDFAWHPEQTSFNLGPGHHDITVHEIGSYDVAAQWRIILDIPYYDRVNVRKYTPLETQGGQLPPGLYRIRSMQAKNDIIACHWGNAGVFMYTADQFPENWSSPRICDQVWAVGFTGLGGYELVPQQHADGRLDCAGGTGPGCQCYVDNSTVAQRYSIESAGSNSWFVRPLSNTAVALTREGGSLAFRPFSRSDNQKWIFERVGEKQITRNGAKASGARYGVFADSNCTNRIGWVDINNGTGELRTNDGTNRVKRGQTYYLKEERAASGHTICNVVSAFVTARDGHWVCVADEPTGPVAVHFMLVDENGNVTEVYTGGAQAGAWLSTGDPMFQAARDKIAQRYEPGVADYADKWYRGEQWYDPAMFGHGKFTGETANKPIYLWAQILTAEVVFFSDGCDSSHIVYRTGRKPLGTIINFAGEIDSKGIRPRCNLNSNFGSESSNGFTGWSLNPDLRDRITSLQIREAKIYRVYGRNRATLRIARAANSAMPDPAGDYRIAPEDGAARYGNPLGVPDISAEKAHVVQGPDGRDLILPAIGDDGADHECGYVGEVMRLPVPRTVYQRMGDGRWKTYRAECWISSPDGQGGIAPVSEAGGGSGRDRRASGSPVSSVTMREDTVRYIRWVETVVDGVETRA